MPFDLSTLDPKKVTSPKITCSGVKYQDEAVIEFKKIYVDSNANNHARVEIDQYQVQCLKVNFSNGIAYQFSPPIVRRNPRVIDGVSYEYELLVGHHRFAAMQSLGYDRWIFWIYEVCLNGLSFDDSKITLQLKENNHYSAKASTIDDATTAICWLLTHNSRLVQNTEDSIWEYVNANCSNMHHTTKGAVVTRVMAKMNTYRRIVTYTAKGAVEWMRKYTDYPIEKGGDYDSKRKKHVWSLLEGYEYEQLFNAMKKYSETGKGSYFVCRTKSPTEKEDLYAKRNGMLNTIEQLENCLLDTYKFYQDNGKFPWHAEAFIPQDTTFEANDEPIFLK